MALDKLDVTMLEDVGTGANQLVQLDSNAKLPALDASNLTNVQSTSLVGNLPAADGSAFTNITAANINGTLPDAVFPTILPARNAQALTDINAANISGTLPSTINLAGVGSAITALTAGNLVGAISAVDGNAVTNLNASNLGTGTIPAAVIPDPLPTLDGSNLTNVPALIVGDGSALTNLTGANVNGVGTLNSDRLTGALPVLDGANLINVPALLVGDGSGLTLLDADEIASGTLDGARFPANLPAVDGSALTNLTASNLSGSIPLSNLVVKQVLSYTKVNGWSSSSDTFVNVPDMEISVTTTQLNSRLLVFGHLALSATSNYSWGGWHIRLTRDGTSMKVGTGASGETYDELGAMGGLTRSDPLHATHPAPFNEVDDPQVASGTTLVYKVQLAATHLFTGSTCTVHVNQSATPGASNGAGVGVSTITVLEVAA